MRYMINLAERIYDPELGEGISSTEYIYEKYYKSNDSRKYFISFTAIDKLGINPGSKYNTPIGVYTYPLSEFFVAYILFNKKYSSKTKENILNRKIGEFAPFAGENPYVWVIKVNKGAGKFIEDLPQVYKNYKEDFEFLVDRYKKIIYEVKNKNFRMGNSMLLSHLAGNLEQANYDNIKLIAMLKSNSITDSELERGIRDTLYSWGEKSNFNKFEGGRIWNMTRLLSDKNPIQWNKLWRDMGYIGVADRSGVGIIHESEKIQAVFFSVKGFDIVDKVQNIKASETFGKDQLDQTLLKLKYDNLLPFFKKLSKTLSDKEIGKALDTLSRNLGVWIKDNNLKNVIEEDYRKLVEFFHKEVFLKIATYYLNHEKFKYIELEIPHLTKELNKLFDTIVKPSFRELLKYDFVEQGLREYLDILND